MKINKKARIFNELPCVYTHGFNFHSDDIFVAAWMEILGVPCKRVDRTGLEGGVYVDFGGGYFDHHQEDALVENGHKYCGFGILWREYAEELYGYEVANTVKKSLVNFIDEADNGVRHNLVSSTISLMNPQWDSDLLWNSENGENCYKIAVELAKIILSAHIERAQATERAVEYAENEITYIDTEIGFVSVSEKEVPTSVLRYGTVRSVAPHKRGGYSVLCLSAPAVGNGYGEMYAPWPEEFRGHIEPTEKMKSIGMTFCHPTGFLANFKTQEAAIKAACTVF